MVKYSLIDKMQLDGGLPCLDYVNTVPDRMDGTNRDLLTSFDELAYFIKMIGLIDTKALKQLQGEAATNPKKADAFFKEAIKLRELVHRIFKSISDQKPIATYDLEAFNKLLAQHFALLKLVSNKGTFKEDWDIEPGNYYAITAPIVKSAHELLLSGKLMRVRECSNCGWLFFDTSKNGKRRWCSMQTCGSNVKSLEYYHRNKNQIK